MIRLWKKNNCYNVLARFMEAARNDLKVDRPAPSDADSNSSRKAEFCQ